MQMREKIGTSRFTVFFQWFVAPEGRKVGSLKRRVRSQLARWDMKKCTPLWREAHFQVKMDKTLEERTTFGSWDVEKVHAVVARSTFPEDRTSPSLPAQISQAQILGWKLCFWAGDKLRILMLNQLQIWAGYQLGIEAGNKLEFEAGLFKFVRLFKPCLSNFCIS